MESRQPSSGIEKRGVTGALVQHEEFDARSDVILEGSRPASAQPRGEQSAHETFVRGVASFEQRV
jgi:hypothetical protein